MSAELAACHDTASLDLERVAIECQNLANYCQELQKKLVLCSHAEGLRACLTQARIALEIAVIDARDADRRGNG